MIVPDRDQFLRQAEEGTLVPVFREFFADLETPVSAYLKISARFPTDHFLLESVEQGALRGIFGQVRVAQDPTRDREEVAADAIDQGVECLFVAPHRSLDELPLHPSPPGRPIRGPVRGV